MSDLQQLFAGLTAAIVAATPALPHLMTAEQAADRLNIDDKTFRTLVRSRKIRFILVGKRRKYTEQDLLDYINKQRDATPCPSTNPKTRSSGTMTSSSKVIGITDLRAQQAKRRPRA